MITLALALRGGVAVGVLIALVGGVPWLVHAGLAVALGLWAALLAPAPHPDSVLLLAASEAVIGATLGVLAALPLVAARTAGRLVDLAGRSRGPYDAMFGVLAAAVFVGIDGHVAVIRAVATSYTSPSAASAPANAIEHLGHLIPTAVHLALPWLVAAAVVELAAGVAGRVGGRAAMHAPYAAAAPAALVMMTAALVSTLAVAIARIILV